MTENASIFKKCDRIGRHNEAIFDYEQNSFTVLEYSSMTWYLNDCEEKTIDNLNFVVNIEEDLYLNEKHDDDDLLEYVGKISEEMDNNENATLETADDYSTTENMTEIVIITGVRIVPNDVIMKRQIRWKKKEVSHSQTLIPEVPESVCKECNRSFSSLSFKDLHICKGVSSSIS